jgi:putative SOS response-associated peptidase YedK
MCNRVSIKSDIKQYMQNTGRECPVEELHPGTYKTHFHASGFNHPLLAVITCENPQVLQLATWGLIPWYAKTDGLAKTEEEAKEIEAKVRIMSNKMLNARLDTLWQLKSYKRCAEYKRCLILVDGIFEWHDWKTEKGIKKIPFYITTQTGNPMVIAGIYDNVVVNGIERFTCSMVTNYAGGRIMGKIHNADPEDPRTPYFIYPGCEGEWISGLPQGPIVQEFAAEELDENLKYYPITDQLAKRGYETDGPESLVAVDYEGLQL